jgi:hypothetical protein
MKGTACLAAFLPVWVLAGPPPPASPIEMNALETLDEAFFDTQGFELFRDGFQCLPDGSVFFVPDVRGRRKPPAAIVRASANGGLAERWSLSSTLGLPDANIHLFAIATDSRGGRLFGLLSNRSGRQVIVSFDDRGGGEAQAYLDDDEIVAQRFAVFDSGEFLLLGGQRTSPAKRLAVMDPASGAMRDVVQPAVASGEADPGSPWLTMNRLSFLVPASDGNVYFVSGDGPAYAIAPTAEIVGTIDLASPQPAGSGAQYHHVLPSGGVPGSPLATRREGWAHDDIERVGSLISPRSRASATTSCRPRGRRRRCSSGCRRSSIL